MCDVFLVSALTDGIKGATHLLLTKTGKTGKWLLPAAAFVDDDTLSTNVDLHK